MTIVRKQRVLVLCSPVLPGVGATMHRNFPDPAAVEKTQARAAFRRVRDSLAAFAEELRSAPLAPNRNNDRVLGERNDSIPPPRMF